MKRDLSVNESMGLFVAFLFAIASGAVWLFLWLVS